MRIRPGWAALAASSAVALCACGGGAGGGNGAAPSLIRLRSQATQICSATNHRTGRIPTPTSETAGGTFLARGVSELSPELRRLERLRAPMQDADTYRTALSAFSSEVALLRAAERSLERGEDPVVAFQALQRRLAPLEDEAARAFAALGIHNCSNR